MNTFKGKVALITGGSRGVGYATAEKLMREGAKVVLTARGAERLESSKEKLIALGGEVAAVAGDVSNPEDAKRMLEVALDNFGRLDILINNAGVSMRGRFDELSMEVCRQVIDTNLAGSIYLSRLAIDHLVEAKGHLVFISSIAGLMGLPGASIYCATKGALTGLADSLRLELIPKGVHVGVVYLGFTEHDPEKRILAADGSAVLPDRPAHHTQAYAADLVLRMIKKRKRKLIMTPVGNLGAFAQRFFPGLVERAILHAQARQWGAFKKFS